ncbi:deoxyadenosine/deoxycytidine kinase [Lewinella marina]|uniref:Deoxynucleoside kinase n=1 Tax=Neolewinella marina TaxID=438751 RepID=A0A2G0CI28_9BACT|nr:deoxynucleoside kinase [Neolewinella marina]NJB85233.1 deoxyadenosine/deoxycytidine kinase [Neolewinella marina]PHK99634.1 deoxynucleoside kinase [Neolewinella marina]
MSLHPFVVVEGNIGAGKTTLSRRLAEQFNHRLILEEFSDNPFLPLFYREPDRYAFPVELFFMAERHKQLHGELSSSELFTEGTVADYLFIKTLLFARNSLSEQEFRLFNRIYRVMDSGFPSPDLIVYLHRPVAALQANIRKRGRDFETEIHDDYLLSVQSTYLNYFRTLQDTPVLILDLDDQDFTQDEELYQRMVAAIVEKYPPGIHRIDLHSLRSSPIIS